MAFAGEDFIVLSRSSSSTRSSQSSSLMDADVVLEDSKYSDSAVDDESFSMSATSSIWRLLGKKYF